ncbi:MAG: hypothetical protein Q7J16_02235 [Candidatus Cloacimonadales bacterium]|nr:hypothetical protein [Candidatus Cloacimonadales bacterium]
MKKYMVIIILISVSLLTSEKPIDQNEINGPQRPLYEKVPLIKDYRINQPIKAAIRWGTVRMAISYFGAYNYFQNYEFYNDSSEKSGEAFQVGWETCKISMIVGGLYGFYTSLKAKSLKKDDLHYRIKEDKIGYEGSLRVDPFIKSDLKTTMSIIITYSTNFWIMNEYQLGVCWVRWPDFGEGMYVNEERKYDFRGVHYFLRDNILSPYYGFGLGFSYGTRRHDDMEYFDDTRIISEGIYPFAHSTAGIRINFLDFFYMKIETDIELSSYYFHTKSYEDYSLLHNLSLGMIFGAKIF